MNSGNKFAKIVGMVALGLTVCLGTAATANAAARGSQRKAAAKKTQPQTQAPPLPSGPTGPVPQVPLDSMTPVPPQVTYQNGQLTIVASNSTLGDILRAVRKQTGADIDIPAASDRVVTHLGPGPVQDVLADLLNGSRFNYVLLGSPEKAGVLTRVVLVPKTAPDKADKAVANNHPAPSMPQPGMAQAMNVTPQEATDTNDADVNDDPNANANMDENPEQPSAEPDQYGTPTDQPQAKTPQQMLQEMQQRQLQFQQQQQTMQQQQQDPAAQPPVYTPGLPQRPQREQ
jgi:hypothetical protein